MVGKARRALVYGTKFDDRIWDLRNYIAGAGGNLNGF